MSKISANFLTPDFSAKGLCNLLKIKRKNGEAVSGHTLTKKGLRRVSTTLFNFSIMSPDIP